MEKATYNYSKISWYVTGLTALILLYYFIWRVDAVGYKSVIDGDGKDYYSYLMSVFIDKNLGHQDTSPWYIIQTPTGTVNVHTAGVALLLLPFFLIGYAWAIAGGYDINGISEPFEKMIGIGALAYALAGLFFIRKLLIQKNISDNVIAWILPLIFFGSNLLNYSLNEPAMSHVYSFCWIAVFMYASYRILNNGELKYFVLAGLSLGIILLVRPINGIIIFILPLWVNSISDLKKRTFALFRERKKEIMVSILLLVSVVLIQCIIWMFQNGRFIQYTYKDNGLYLFSPNMLKMLFGFNSGFFIYTPLCFVLLMGLIYYYQKNRYHFAVLSVFFLFVFYLFSCHWAYTYFDGLGIRALVDFYPVFAIPGALFIGKLSSSYYKIAGTLIIACVVYLNLVFCYQYKAGILPPAGMNFDKFSYIFLKTDKKYAGVLGGCNDIRPYSKNHPEPSFVYENHFDETNFYTYNENEFGLAYEIAPIGFASSKIYVKIELKRKEGSVNSSEKALIVLDIQGKDKASRNFQAYKLNDTPSESCCDWRTWNYAVTMDGKIQATDKLIVYIWNKEKKEFYIDDFKVEVYNYNYKV